MKYFIIGDKDTRIEKLSLELSDYYGIDVFHINESDNIDEINKISRENKEWIIEGTIIDNIDVLCNLCDIIIFLDYSKKKMFRKKTETVFDSNQVIKLMKKHIRKGIIIRSDSQLKKYLKSVYESDRYNF